MCEDSVDNKNVGDVVVRLPEQQDERFGAAN